MTAVRAPVAPVMPARMSMAGRRHSVSAKASQRPVVSTIALDAPVATSEDALTWVAANGHDVDAGMGTVHKDAAISNEISPVMAQKNIQRPVIFGVAADSGCGKSTFLRRVNAIFGTTTSKAHTPTGDLITTICLDDFHTLDRTGRKDTGISALDVKANNFKLMADQLKALKQGRAIKKPIYNHDTGAIDPVETIHPNHIIIVEGLHPMLDKDVIDSLDFTFYIDVSDPVKKAWKIERDMVERGHKKEDIIASIESRKPDFEKFVEPQKANADVIISIEPTKLDVAPGEETKYLNTRLIQKENQHGIRPVYMFEEEGAVVDWDPCASTGGMMCPYPGTRVRYYDEVNGEKQAHVLEVDGVFGETEELFFIEERLSNTNTKYFGELTKQMLKNKAAPGSGDGSGLIQALVALKMRESYERFTGRTIQIPKWGLFLDEY
uniref:Phosphoribulokinase, chloroplastic n=1 Tax=Lotharella oceanica TaxID=641309 RepID=A0A7S2TLK6_9EUKA